MDVDLDRLEAGPGVEAEYVLVERGFAHGLARARDQRLEHRVLLGSQGKDLAPEPESAPHGVVLERADFQGRTTASMRTADGRVAARLELRELERLRQVIVGNGVVAAPANVERAPRR